MDLTLILCYLVLFIIVLHLITSLIDNYFPKDLDAFFQKIDKLSSKKVVKIKLFHKDQYLINDPDLIHKVLNSEVCLQKPNMFYKFFGLSGGLLCCECETKIVSKIHRFNNLFLQDSQWRRDRRNFSASFNQVMVKGFIPIFCQIADRMIEKLNSHEEQEIDIIHFTERCTISMILGM